jgi:iron complex transport system ATP-binding protein
MVIATHELDLSLKIADQIWLIDHQGAIITGTPEDLVLDGRISQIFNHRQYSFDEGSGGFSIKANGPKITVVGNGKISLWTKRAVERAGFKPVNSGGILEIRCSFDNSKPKWNLVTPNEQISCKSIEELIDFLNKHKPT